MSLMKTTFAQQMSMIHDLYGRSLLLSGAHDSV